jgi:hypothetical protein
MKVDIFFNSNWATDYAIHQAREFGFHDGTLRVLPPESICFFKFINADDDLLNLRAQKDMTDVAHILTYVKEEDLERIDNYVKKSLTRLESCEKQLALWEKLFQGVLRTRQINKE